MDCLARGGDLVRISSHAVWTTITTFLKRYPRQRYWIGLAGIYWYWSDGKWLYFMFMISHHSIYKVL